MKKLVISMSLLIAMSAGNMVQAQGLGNLVAGQQQTRLMPPMPSSGQLREARLQEVQNLQAEVQTGLPVQAVRPNQGPMLPSQQIPQLPVQRPLLGPVQGPLQGPLQGPVRGPVQGPVRGPVQGPLVDQGQRGVLGPAAPGGVVVVEERIEVRREVPVVTSEISIGAIVREIPGIGLEVIRVIPGSKADLMAVQPGDLIKTANRLPVSSAGQFEALLHQALELHLHELNLLVRNGAYGHDPHAPEFSIIRLRLVRAHRPIVVEEYQDHHNDHHYDHHYVRPTCGGGN